MPILTQTATHILALRGRIRVRKYHVKAALAYGGALGMGLDAGVFLLIALFPHVGLALHAMEGGASACGKCGAAASGFAAFFDRIIANGIAQESATV